MTKHVVVIGGGLAGLSAARHLANSGAAVSVLEADRTFGGKLKTSAFRGRPLDLGPDSFITRTPDAEVLCRDLGLGDELIAPTSATAAIFARGELRPFPAGLVLGIPTDLKALARSGIVSRVGLARAALDLIDPRGHDASTSDPTVAQVVGRRLGREVLYSLADPLIGGINASDVEVLSFSSAAPQLADAAAHSPSLLRGLRPLAQAARQRSGPAFYGLSRGMSSLVDALCQDLEQKGVRLISNCKATKLRADRQSGGFEVDLGDGPIRVDGVVVALPPAAAASMLEGLDERLGEECGEIKTASVATITLAWREQVVPARLRSAFEQIAARSPRPTQPLASGALPGNGVLVPRASGRLITAATFTSTKWPRSANPSEVVVRASVGRHHDDRGLRLSDSELTRAVEADLEVILGFAESPLEVRVERWRDSFPQYESGHAARVERIEARVARHVGLALCGASYRGIGIPACVQDGKRAARQVLTAIS